MADDLAILLADACREFSDAPAIESGGMAFSYTQLAAAARMVTRELAGRGLTANEPVLVKVANSAQDLILFKGVWEAGGVVVPVAASAPSTVVEQTRAATAARFLAAGGDDVVSDLGDAPPKPRAMLAGAAFIIFTSGSTGRPKGVVLSHRGFAGKLRAIDKMLHFSRVTRALLVLQTTFVFGIWVSLLTLMKGGFLLMHSRFDAVAMLAALGEQRITDLAVVPTMLRKILAVDPAISALLIERLTVGRKLTGGEPFGRELNRQIQQLLPQMEMVDIYGLTETCSSDFFCFAGQQGTLAGTIGSSSPGVRFRVADEHGNEVPADETGELQIHTPFIMSGYLDEIGLTRGTFAGDYFRTGDLARVRQDGAVELIGRAKELIMRGGAKVAPLELDYLLAQHPAVAAALTVGIPDAVVGERIHVLVVPRANAEIVEADLRDWVDDRVERFKRPDVYHIGSELPVGRTGKVDRNALRQKIRGSNA
jgi:long-chain acyl-CoA synthetase